ALSGVAPWLEVWPQALRAPLTDWIGEGLAVALGALKPAARLLSAALTVPMEGVNTLLTGTHWLGVSAVLLALAWWIGRWSMLLTALASLSFILASGYWLESMNTLSLVLVSVPLALSLGLLMGVTAYVCPHIRHVVETLSDVMQTVPT